MSTTIIQYSGNLRTTATHVKSGEIVITDAPIDNNGKGEAFSPTDLLVSSLASCMLTIMGIVAEKNNISIDGISANATKIMDTNPRRVAKIIIEFNMNNLAFTDNTRSLLETAALNCPVAKSLSDNLEQEVLFNW